MGRVVRVIDFLFFPLNFGAGRRDLSVLLACVHMCCAYAVCCGMLA